MEWSPVVERKQEEGGDPPPVQRASPLLAALLPLSVARWSLVALVVSPVFMRYATAFMPEATVLAF